MLGSFFSSRLGMCAAQLPRYLEGFSMGRFEAWACDTVCGDKCSTQRSQLAPSTQAVLFVCSWKHAAPSSLSPALWSDRRKLNAIFSKIHLDVCGLWYTVFGLQISLEMNQLHVPRTTHSTHVRIRIQCTCTVTAIDTSTECIALWSALFCFSLMSSSYDRKWWEIEISKRK